MSGGHVDVAWDRDGNRYTTRCFSFRDDDPWRGAMILTPPVVTRLRAHGLLPLTLAAPRPDVESPREDRRGQA